MSAPAYFDYHATTPVDRRVVEAMAPYWSEQFGNPSSRSHSYGWQAKSALKMARSQVAKAIKALSSEVVFTSGATEANNLALIGTWQAYRGKHIVLSSVEHPSVSECAKALQGVGVEVSWCPVNKQGLVSPDDLSRLVREDTYLVSVVSVQSEIGTIQPIKDIIQSVKSKNSKTLVHTDASQGLGRIPLDVMDLGVDLLSLSAHKAYGPKGIGALYVRNKPKVHVDPIFHGGGQEKGLRSGTLPTALCVGLGRACELATNELSKDLELVEMLNKRIVDGLHSMPFSFSQFGSLEKRVPGNMALGFHGVSAEKLLLACSDVAFSTGSACSGESGKSASAFAAIGLSKDVAVTAFRLGFGRMTTRLDVDVLLDSFKKALPTLSKKESL